MNLDLSLVLSLSQQEAFTATIADSDLAIEREEEAAVTALRQTFHDKRLATRRAILLELLGVGKTPEETPPSPRSIIDFFSEPVPAGDSISWDEAAGTLGVSRDTVRIYAKKGILTALEQGFVSRSSVDAYQATRLSPGWHKAPPPTPKAVEAPVKHSYHWRNALPVLEAGIAQAEAAGEVAIEVAYQSTPGNFEEAGAFVTRPFGRVGEGLTPFVRATQEAGKWSVTIPLRVESWLKPMAEGLKCHWADLSKVQEVRSAATLMPPSSDSPMRSLLV